MQSTPTITLRSARGSGAAAMLRQSGEQQIARRAETAWLADIAGGTIVVSCLHDEKRFDVDTEGLPS